MGELDENQGAGNGMNDNPTTEEIANWVEWSKTYREQSKQFGEIADHYAQLVKAALPDGFSGTLGSRQVTMIRSQVFDQALAAEVLTPEEAAMCTVGQLDPTLVKRMLSPDRYDRCRRPANSTTLKIK